MTLRSLFDAIVREVLPHAPAARLARRYDIAPRRVQYFLSGQQETPREIESWIESQRQIVSDVRFADRVDAVVQTGLNNGLDTEVVASHLAAAYEKLTNRPIS